jgi:hypothetical protein
LWLIWHIATASKDNMSKRGWIGDTKCRFCDEEKDIHHIFFLCAAAKYMWDVVSLSVGAQTGPANFTQYIHWIAKFAKGLSNIHVVGLCWAMWK